MYIKTLFLKPENSTRVRHTHYKRTNHGASYEGYSTNEAHGALELYGFLCGLIAHTVV